LSKLDVSLILYLFYSTYGETAFLGLQTFIIWMLVFHYNGQSGLGGVAAAVYSIVLYTFLSGLVPIEVLTFLQSSTIPVLIVSRVSVFSVIQSLSTLQVAVLMIRSFVQRHVWEILQ